MRQAAAVSGTWIDRATAGIAVVVAGTALLSACGGNLDNNAPAANTTVVLATPADALRELGNTAVAAGLLQLPSSFSCASGSDDITGSGSKTRAFVYFTGFSGSVNFQVNDYAGCVSGGTTLNGILEAGATADGSYSYAVRGTPETPLLQQSDNAGGVVVSVAESLLGTTETHVFGTQTETRSGLETVTTQTPVGASAPSYKGSFAIGINGPTFDLLLDSSGNGGNGSETIAGAYTYASTTCSGGVVTATTPSALLLTPSSSGNYPAGGVLTLSSGPGSVTYTFGPSGATLSGSVSGSLSSAQVQQAFGSGSGC
jgi:hypothetical protein